MKTTAYEIIVQAIDGRRFRLCYSERRTNRCLMQNVASFRNALLPLIDDGDYRMVGLRIVGAGGWWIGYSGRTELVARQEGELSPIK